ncbi:MAG: hypothetical protein WDN66_05400 [Candidatus Saccharibacteria bacterium]
MAYPKGETPQRLDLLSVAIGAEFSECSIAAAELNKQVHEALDSKGLRTRRLYSIGEDDTVGETFTIRKLDYDLTTTNEGVKDKFELALIRPAKYRRGKGAVMQKAIENSADNVGTEPQLVALLGGEDAYVSLATFARREGGTCSYVQLGSEIRDDNLFVTTADEGTSRQDIIERIRAYVSSKDADTEPPLISNLLITEVEGKQQANG